VGVNLPGHRLNRCDICHYPLSAPVIIVLSEEMAEVNPGQTTQELLFIDDDASVRLCWGMVFEDMCRSAGVSVIAAESADEGLELLVDERSNFWPLGVIVDGLEGECWRVTDRARACGVPVLLFTLRDELVYDADNRGVPAVMKSRDTNTIKHMVREVFPFMTEPDQ